MKRLLVPIILIIICGSAVVFPIVSRQQKSYVNTKSRLEGRLNYNQSVKNLNEGWDNIELGNQYVRNGASESAIEAYKRAYEVDPGNRLMSGKLLVENYEKLNRYDEAINVVDDILKNQPLGEYGLEKYSSMRTRLLAAKAQAEQKTEATSP